MKQAQLAKTAFLPVYFFGGSYLSARDRVMAFWNDKKAKKAAMVERGRKLGQSRPTAGSLST